EAAAWADGSFGWALNLGAGANMFAAFLPPEIAKKLFIHAEICIAGSGALSGKAEKVDGGYLVNGSWRYATGAPHAQFFSISCLLTENGEPTSKTQSFIVPSHQVTITDLWNSHGLKATASHDFKIEDVLVPDDFSFNLTEPSIFADSPLYKIPFLPLAEALLAVTMSGMGCHFIDLLKSLLKEKIQANPNRSKDYPAMETAIQAGEATLNKVRDDLYKTVSEAWLRYEGGETVDEVELDQIISDAKRCAFVTRTEVDKLYPWAGMDAIIPESELNRVWRDIHTASQHILLSPFPN
ncbi:MAG TPA: hypothetical protein VK618_06065, partial [Flavitalea sp.]|nr:hypothetical protein [Flavitalea sp.]